MRETGQTPCAITVIGSALSLFLLLALSLGVCACVHFITPSSCVGTHKQALLHGPVSLCSLLYAAMSASAVTAFSHVPSCAFPAYATTSAAVLVTFFYHYAWYTAAAYVGAITCGGRQHSMCAGRHTWPSKRGVAYSAHGEERNNPCAPVDTPGLAKRGVAYSAHGEVCFGGLDFPVPFHYKVGVAICFRAWKINNHKSNGR